MVVSEGDSKKRISDNFDLKTEISALVENNVISQRIAEKLEQKIIEKNVKLGKDQLNSLALKIKDIMNNYSKVDQPIKKGSEDKINKRIQEKTNEDMLRLVQKIENLEQKIKNFENTGLKRDITIDKKGNLVDRKKQAPTLVMQDDIKIPKYSGEGSVEYSKDPLTQLPTDPESIIILMKWLQYLIDKCGHINLSKILDYYVDIDWISADVKISLIDYSHGITDEKGKVETIKKEISDLPSKDHIQSFIFIQKLKGNQFDKHFIERIESDISRITKKISNNQYK